MIAIYFGPTIFTEEGRIAGSSALSGLLKRGKFDPRKPRRSASRAEQQDLGDFDDIAATVVHVATSGWYRSPDDLIDK
jgi:hypothetical protein